MLCHFLDLRYTSCLGLKRAHLISLMDTDITGLTHSPTDHVLSFLYQFMIKY